MINAFKPVRSLMDFGLNPVRSPKVPDSAPYTKSPPPLIALKVQQVTSPTFSETHSTSPLTSRSNAAHSYSPLDSKKEGIDQLASKYLFKYARAEIPSRLSFEQGIVQIKERINTLLRDLEELKTLERDNPSDDNQIILSLKQDEIVQARKDFISHLYKDINFDLRRDGTRLLSELGIDRVREPLMHLDAQFLVKKYLSIYDHFSTNKVLGGLQFTALMSLSKVSDNIIYNGPEYDRIFPPNTLSREDRVKKMVTYFDDELDIAKTYIPLAVNMKDFISTLEDELVFLESNPSSAIQVTDQREIQALKLSLQYKKREFAELIFSGFKFNLQKDYTSILFDTGFARNSKSYANNFKFKEHAIKLVDKFFLNNPTLKKDALLNSYLQGIEFIALVLAFKIGIDAEVSLSFFLDNVFVKYLPPYRTAKLEPLNQLKLMEAFFLKEINFDTAFS